MIEYKEIISLLISWPAVVMLSILTLRKPISLIVNRLINSETGKAKIGPVEVELGKMAEDGQKAINNINQMNLTIAKSRLLELEITKSHFADSFSRRHKEQLQCYIDELNKKINTCEDE